jgi:hypothetical protein
MIYLEREPIGNEQTVDALLHTMVRASAMLARGPYPRRALPDEVWCLDCAIVMPVTMQVEHRRLYDHAAWEWAGNGIERLSVAATKEGTS